jgi:YceI-like domain
MKKKAILLSGLFILSITFINAQGKFYTKSGKISFFSATSVENIDAANKSVVCLLDSKTGNLQFVVLMKGFEFKKALMQEHFNSDYVESDKFPKADFTGKIMNNNGVDYQNNGTYSAYVEGKLTIHGVTKDVEATGTVTVKDGKLIANCTFNVVLTDYEIKVPKLYRDNISRSIKIMVDCSLDPLK